MTIGWGSVAYGFVCGASASIAVVFLLIGGRTRRVDPLMVSFGLFALASSVSAAATIHLHRSATMSAYEDAVKVYGIVLFVTLISIVVVIAVWTGTISRWAMTIWAVATVPIGILQLWLPNGLLAGDIDELRSVQLFGEQFVVNVATSSPWRPVLDVYLFATLGMLIVALARGYRLGHRRSAAVVSLGFLIGLGFATWDTFVDWGRVNTPYLAPFGLLAALVGGAIYLAERSVRTDRRLAEQTFRLEETVVDRTAALRKSNHELEAQLARQRRSARTLAVLAQEFEASNALVDPDPAAVATLLDQLLGQLGAVLLATSVELRIDDNRYAELLPRSSLWRASDSPDDGTGHGGTTDLCAPIEIGSLRIGELVARSVPEHKPTSGESSYVELTAEHLAGLFQRLELVERVAESAVEGERQRIAMDLHDSVTQRMYSIAFLADAAVHLAEEDPANVGEPVRRVRELVLSSLAELRALLVELRPAAFESEDLAGLISQLAESVASRSEQSVDAQVGTLPPMGAEVKVAMYRIAQEALSNACRHSGADRVRVKLGHDAGVTTLEVSDDGIGFTPSDVNGGSGLGNLRSRAARIGAELDVVSRPGSGTSVEVRFTQAIDPAAPAPEAAEA